MNNRNIVSLCAFLVVSLAGAPSAALGDDSGLLKDAGFELQTAADEGGWRLFEISLFSKNYARSGSQSMFNGGFSRTVPNQGTFVGNVSGAYQEFPAVAGTRWRLTGYALTPETLAGTSAFGILQVSFFDADGEDLGTVETAGGATKAKTSSQIDRSSQVGQWISLDTGVATAPEGTATIQAFTLFVDFSGSNRTQGVYFDDLSLCELSEGSESDRCDPE